MLQGSYDEKYLRESFRLIEKSFPAVVDAFYEEFFSRYPEHAKLFNRSHSERQKKQMVKALVSLVKYANEPRKLSAALAQMGRHHGDMGIKAVYYNQMIDVMLDVLRKFLGAHWNEQIHNAWYKALINGAKAMIIAYR